MSLAVLPDADRQPARRAKSPRAPRAKSRQVASVVRKVSFYLSPENIRRLGVVASMTDTDKSRALERIISDSPIVRSYVVQRRGAGDGNFAGEGIGGDVAA